MCTHTHTLTQSGESAKKTTVTRANAAHERLKCFGVHHALDAHIQRYLKFL